LPQFEVASVKAFDTRGFDTSAFAVLPTFDDPRRFRAVQVVSGQIGILEWAYGVRSFQVFGGPEWLKTELFEIQARAEHPSSEGQIKQMVQRLLADRFKLKLHRETREIPIYALVVGKNGPKLPAAKDASLNHGLDSYLKDLKQEYCNI
jgi:uncharacterized protein (TIGR03435 family)